MLTLSSFSTELARVLATVSETTFDDAVKLIRGVTGEIYFIGNGGSAALASHMAIDWANKAGYDTRDLNNPAALTCLANDYGYENVFVRQLENIGDGDLLVAISSSGKSHNIIKAVKRAWDDGAMVIALSGFDCYNDLQRHNASVKFHIPSDNYAIVENAHMAILHAMLEALRG